MSFNFDLYMLFVEQCLGRLHPKGRLAFIIPHRFTNGLAGGAIRNVLGPRLERLVHFSEEQVFPGRSTYTALLIVGPKTAKSAKFEIVTDLKSWRLGVPGVLNDVLRNSLKGDPWPIASAEQAAIFDKMEAAAVGRLGEPTSSPFLWGTDVVRRGVLSQR